MFYEEHISLGLIDNMEGTRHFFLFFFCPELSLSSGKLRIVLKIVRHGNFPQSISQTYSTLIKVCMFSAGPENTIFK